MAHRVIGQEKLGFAAGARLVSSLDTLSALIDWSPVMVLLAPVHASAKGEAAWPPLAMFKALLLSVWYDLSDVKLAEALDGRASFRRFCGFSGTEPVPERTAFVRFRRALIEAVRARGGTPRVVATAMWGRDEQETLGRLKAHNRPIHQVRGRIEKIFGTWKRSYGLRRMRWRGIAKATAQVLLTAIAYNLKRSLTITTQPA
jgi:hypothetical protein